ncbi:MAG: hypothetical protein KAU28_09495, partial [Phycisphaerae bacterium]|nr:hypothetical protein [Phycisphaerae bacterium]
LGRPACGERSRGADRGRIGQLIWAAVAASGSQWPWLARPGKQRHAWASYGGPRRATAGIEEH